VKSDTCTKGDRGQGTVRWDGDVVEDVASEGGNEIRVFVETVEAWYQL
jgi:hypothetical protein